MGFTSMARSRCSLMFLANVGCLFMVSIMNAVVEDSIDDYSQSQESKFWCDSCIVSCLLMESTFASCDKGPFYTGVYNGRLGFEVWMHSLTDFHISNQVKLATGREQREPLAYIDAGPSFTNAFNLTVRIVLEPTCANAGFQCRNPLTCDLVVTGDGVVLPSTLQSARGGRLLSLTIALETRSETGKVNLALARDFCTNSSDISRSHRLSAAVTIHFDRQPVSVNLWTAVPDTPIQVNKVSKTVQATNKVSDLKIYLDFTHPVRNTSEELMNVLTSNHGILKAVHRTSHGNRQFGFQLSNVQSSAAIITVSLDTSHVLSRAGTVARAPDAVTFLYDMVKPKVKLAVSSLGFETRDRIISVAVVFTKPVFLFTLKSVTAINGRVTRLDEISKSLYLVHVLANEGMTVTLFVPENKTVDIAGNLNDPSSILHVKHYFVPAVSIGLYSFTTASFLATTFAAGVLSVSAASLAAVGALTQTAMKSIVSDPSKNLLNMAGHLQVFALSSRLAVGLPVEYIETARGLQWLIPSVKPPWEHEKKLPSIHWNRKMPDQIFTSATVNMLIAERARGRILAANATLYGPALLPAEYNIYFSVQNFNTLSATDNLLADRNNGWHDFESNMFWLGISAMILIFLHLLTLAIFKWKFRSAATGALIFPRFELFILIYALPGFCQAVASIIRGGTMKGLIIGVFLLAIPASFLFSVVLFLGVAVIAGRFVQYNEVRWGANANGWCTRAWLCIIGYKTVGTWSCKGELPSSFLGRFGLLFEDRKGPSHVITVSSDKSESLQHWVGSGSSGIGSKKVEDFKDESSDAVVSGNGKVLGAAQATYIAVDLTRRVVLGITFGAYDPNSLSWCQPSIILGSTVVQLLYLIGFRPYIKRGLQLVETLSFLCEALFFALSFAFLASSPVDDHTLGMAMLALLLSTLVLQLGNEWHALMNQLLELSPTQTPSLKVGAKMLLWGLVLPFIPDKWCSKFMSNFPGQPNRGLVTVVPVSQEEILPPVVQQMEGAKNVALGPKVPSSDETGIEESTRAVADPNAAGECICSHLDMSVGAHGKKSWCTTTSSELKTLRELAKASFLQSQKEDSITRFNGASKSVQAHSRMTSLGSLEHPAPSRSALHSFHPPGISSEGSSSADLEIIER